MNEITKPGATGAKRVALGGLLVACVTAATLLSLPLPGFRLYFNMGEGILYTIALTKGPFYGAAAGGIGASLADLILGYPLWAPFTLVIKGLEGFLVGALRKKRLPALAVGMSVMIAGYTTLAGILYGWKAAPVEFFTDVLQTGIGAGVALLLTKALERFTGKN
ncbi:MAG: ECF transporter S component [Synergistales bacterium]|jgi:uncharacterized membrane protein